METNRVGFACALGGSLGALVALEFAGALALSGAWQIAALAAGMAVGGLTGYLAYDIREVGLAISRAYRAVVGWRPKPDWERMRLLHMAAFMFSTIIASAFGWAFAVMAILSVSLEGMALPEVFYMVVLVGGIIFSAAFTLFYVVVLLDRRKHEQEQHRKVIVVLKPMVKVVNPIVLPFYATYQTFKGAWWCAVRIPAATVALCRITKRVFVYIHSDIRTLCLTDAALGAAAGFFAGSALVGGIAGALFGILNYEIISRRVLKVAPARVSKE